MPEQDESSIERLKRTLYSRDEKVVPKEKMTPVSPREFEVPTTWGDKPKYDLPPEVMIKRNNSFFNKYLIGSLSFFAVSVAIAVFIFFGGVNMISSNNLDVEVIAPTSISSGEELSVGLSVVNGNRTDLTDVTLYINYPDGTYSVTDETKPVTHEEVNLGKVEKGGTIEHSVRAILFGEKDTLKSFTFRIEYKVKGSNAVFSKEKVYDVLIGSSPILLEVDYPKEVNSGQSISLSIEITSNSSVPIKDALVKVEYPYGFTYKGSNVTPVRDNSIWSLGDLKNGDKKKITVNGVLIGQNEEDRSFRISAGTKNGTIYDFKTPLVSTLVTLGIRKSFFDLSASSDNNNVIQPGQTSGVNLKWQNTLPDKIADSLLEVKITGNALDRTRVSASNGGFYRSVDDVVYWDRNSTPSLIEMSPGDTGNVSMILATLPSLVQPKFIKNAHIDLQLMMRGERLGRDGGIVTSTEDITIKVATAASLTGKSLHDTGPFTNSGPLPPKADTESTYTINWVLTNTTNDLKNTIVRASLPPGVSWKGEISPSSEKISYDPNSRVITWDAGNVAAGSGFVSSSKQVYFKVGIIPSVSQVGSVPTLVSQANLTSTDTYTERSVETSASFVTTKYSDANFVSGKEIVVN